jgi:hypothetical protein
VALTSFFFTFFKVFLNGFRGLFVPSNPRLTEGAKGWQAFFSLFFKFFLNPIRARIDRIPEKFWPRIVLPTLQRSNPKVARHNGPPGNRGFVTDSSFIHLDFVSPQVGVYSGDSRLF